VPALTTWSLRQRLGAAIVVLAAVLIGTVVTAVLLLLSLRDQQHAVVKRYFTAVGLSNQRFIEQLDAETAVRGYALSGTPVALQPFRMVGTANYTTEVGTIRHLLNTDPSVVAAFDAWDRAAAQWYVRWAQPTIHEIRARGGRSVSSQEVLTGKALFDTVRGKYARYSARLVARRNAASDDLQLRTTLLFVAVLVVIGALAAVGALSWWGLRRWVLRPIADLGAQTRLVRSGHLDHQMQVTGPLEIAQLTADVEAMRRDIVEKLAAVEVARAEIETARTLVEAQAAELARSNRDLEQFAYVASHDLQEPLRKVASFCQMLERRYAGQLDERADQYIAFAVDGAKRMQQLINDLLAFSRVGRTEQVMTDVNLQSCLETALDNLSVLIEAQQGQVDADPLPHVRGDSVLLTQLLQNLIGNAIKFHGEQPPRVRITAKQGAEFWEFGCTDNGLGIEPQYAERIFVIFQRLHGKEEYVGTGIGLALCKRIVEYHGGQIWLDPSASVGATFRWTLPVQPSESLDAEL
jgi:signal transduction histidine kinase